MYVLSLFKFQEVCIYTCLENSFLKYYWKPIIPERFIPRVYLPRETHRLLHDGHWVIVFCSRVPYSLVVCFRRGRYFYITDSINIKLERCSNFIFEIAFFKGTYKTARQVKRIRYVGFHLENLKIKTNDKVTWKFGQIWMAKYSNDKGRIGLYSWREWHLAMKKLRHRTVLPTQTDF